MPCTPLFVSKEGENAVEGDLVNTLIIEFSGC
jgi:hypothetical protein